MNTATKWLTAILLIGAFPALSIYAWQTTPVYTEQGAVEAATRFVSEAPTYSWDGVEGSIRVLNSYKAQTSSAVWTVVIEFTCANAGYGDRTGQMVATVVTDHVISVTVEKGSVVEAVIDGAWDEIRQTAVIHDDATLEEAEETAREFVESSPTFSFDGIPGSIEVGDVVAAESYPIQYFMTVKFECRHAGYGDRTGQMLAQVITPHEMRITISGGQVLSAVIDGVWDELNQREKVVSELLPPEEARDLAVRYVVEHHPELGVEAPHVWEAEELTPEDLLGFSKTRYTSGVWTVNISHPVVWKPVYSVEITVDADPVFEWVGSVGQDSSVTPETK